MRCLLTDEYVQEISFMKQQTTSIRTEDGLCPAYTFEPHRPGQWPGVVMFMDGIGIRPALFEIAERLAGGGYYVLLPDLYYRSGFSAAEGARLFRDPVVTADWKQRVVPTVSAANIMRDMKAFIGFLNSQPTVRAGKIGTTGYCLGGRLSLTAAGHFPDGIAAAASYHGGQLATDAPDSPHRLAPAMKARVYVAGAIEQVTGRVPDRGPVAPTAARACTRYAAMPISGM